MVRASQRSDQAAAFEAVLTFGLQVWKQRHLILYAKDD